MNPRTFKGQQGKSRQSNTKADRSIAPLPAIIVQNSREQCLDDTQMALGSGSAAALSLAEQNAVLRQKALGEIKQGRYDAAIALFSLLIERNPQSVNDYNNRGLLYVRKGQFANALDDYDAALRLNPRLAKVYNNRANCYASLGRPMEALFDYETALDLNPANTHARINQGITFRELEMYEHAIETFDLALQFDQMLSGSGGVDAVASIAGHIYAQRGRTSHLAGDWNYAIADYRRTLAVLSPSETMLLDVSLQLRLQINHWLSELLAPQPEA